MSKVPEPSSVGSLESHPDRARVRWVRTLACVVGAAALLGAAFWMDATVVEWVRADSNGWGRWFAGRVSFWGDWYGVVALGVVVWWMGRRPGWEPLRRLALLMGLCAAVAGLGANGIRAVTGRARPFAEAAPGWYGVARGGRVWTKGARDYQSFPSAHTSVVAGFLAPLALVACRQGRRSLRFLGVGVAVLGTGLMAWARVWVGAHHLSDVAAATLLGLAVSVVCLGSRRLSRRFTFAGGRH